MDTTAKSKIEVIQGDITRQQVDAIVNAANTSLLGGGGVDGAIHRAAGPELLEECRALNGCATGDAKITKGYKLPARFVIHTVGPVWHGGSYREEELLASAYRRSLEVAVENGVKTIAFPAISTGIYSFPLERATQIAVLEVRAFLADHAQIEKVIFVCFDSKTYDMYKKLTAAA
jgi:O-acetyl-ADP-ribose deacetylase (regulator of RNase III)